MAIPVYVTGQVLAASDCNNWFVPLAAAWKTGATGRTTTSLTIDPDLQFAMPASATYEITASIVHQTTGGSSAFNFAWTTPSSPVFSSYSAAYTQPGPVTNGWGHAFDGSLVSVAGSDNLVHGINIAGIIQSGTSSGTFGLSWSAATASAGTVSVLSGSFLVARRIG